MRARGGATLRTVGDVAEWLRSGLQSRLHRFDSGRRLLSRLDGITFAFRAREWVVMQANMSEI
jgi:hypothetical protein